MAGTPEPRFPFPLLHDIPQQCVLQSMRIDELMKFASLTPATESIVRRLRLHLDEITLNLTPEMEHNVYLCHTRRDMTKTDYVRVFVLPSERLDIEHLEQRNRDRLRSVNLRLPNPTVAYYLNTVPRFWNIDLGDWGEYDNRVSMFLEVVEYFLDIFNLHTLRIAMTATDFFDFEVWTMLASVQVREITLLDDDTVVTMQKIKNLMENHQINELNIHCELAPDSVYDEPLTIPKMLIKHATWLSFDAILMMTTEYLFVCHYFIPPPENFNLLIRRWMEMDILVNLQRLTIKMRPDVPDGYREDVLMDIPIVLDHEIDPAAPRRTTHEIKRKDGKQAVLELTEHSFDLYVRPAVRRPVIRR